MDIEQLQKDIQAIQERNSRVELEKAWETSATRRLSIVVLTYVVVVIFFWTAGIDRPMINAIVPTGAFIISTLSLPYLKKIWMRGK